MADAVVSAVLQQLLSVAGQEIQAGMKLVKGVDEEVKMLTTNFQIIQAVLAEAEQRQITETGVRVWLEKLKEVSYDMDDVLDMWNTTIMKRLQLEGSKDAHTLNSKFKRIYSKNNDKAIIKAFQPPPNLQRLSITKYKGHSMSGLRMTSLTNLRSISLIQCIHCLCLPPLGKLSSLETLYIRSMPSLREVGNEFVGVESHDTSSFSSVISFPKLKTLEFVAMYEWEAWDFGIEDDTKIMFMPSLHTLKFLGCYKLKGLPKQLLEKAPLQNLSIEYCDILQKVYGKGKGDKWDHISHIPNIHI